MDNQPEISDVQEICEELIKSTTMHQMDWRSIIANDYDEFCNCDDVMQKLTDKLCTRLKNPYLINEIMKIIQEEKEMIHKDTDIGDGML